MIQAPFKLIKNEKFAYLPNKPEEAEVNGNNPDNSQIKKVVKNSKFIYLHYFPDQPLRSKKAEDYDKKYLFVYQVPQFYKIIFESYATAIDDNYRFQLERNEHEINIRVKDEKTDKLVRALLHDNYGDLFRKDDQIFEISNLTTILEAIEASSLEDLTTGQAAVNGNQANEIKNNPDNGNSQAGIAIQTGTSQINPDGQQNNIVKLKKLMLRTETDVPENLNNERKSENLNI